MNTSNIQVDGKLAFANNSATLPEVQKSDLDRQEMKVLNSVEKVEDVPRNLEQGNLVKVKPPPNPGIFGAIFFTWLNSIVNLGYRRNREGKGIEPEDLWELRPQFQGQNVKDAFEAAWKLERSRPKPSITRALWRMVHPLVLTSAAFEIIRIVASFANPLILKAARPTFPPRIASENRVRVVNEP
jgi:hypothetical protein